MISIKGIFDGKKVKCLEKVDINEPQKVIITFLGTSKDESLISGNIQNLGKGM